MSGAVGLSRVISFFKIPKPGAGFRARLFSGAKWADSLMTLPGASPGVSNGWKSGVLLPLACLRESAVGSDRRLLTQSDRADFQLESGLWVRGRCWAVSFDLLQSVTPRQADGE
jgi:hypothetical protein